MVEEEGEASIGRNKVRNSLVLFQYFLAFFPRKSSGRILARAAACRRAVLDTFSAPLSVTVSLASTLSTLSSKISALLALSAFIIQPIHYLNISYFEILHVRLGIRAQTWKDETYAL